MSLERKKIIFEVSEGSQIIQSNVKRGCRRIPRVTSDQKSFKIQSSTKRKPHKFSNSPKRVKFRKIRANAIYICLPIQNQPEDEGHVGDDKDQGVVVGGHLKKTAQAEQVSNFWSLA